MSIIHEVIKIVLLPSISSLVSAGVGFAVRHFAPKVWAAVKGVVSWIKGDVATVKADVSKAANTVKTDVQNVEKKL